MSSCIHGEEHGWDGGDNIYHILELLLQKQARRTSLQNSKFQEICSGELSNLNSGLDYTANYPVHKSEEMHWRSPSPPLGCHTMSMANFGGIEIESEYGILHPLDYAAFQLDTAFTFGAPSLIKIPINPAFCGAIIGKKGSNAKLLCRNTGLQNLTVQDDRFSRDVKYLVMEGSLHALCEAVQFVRHLIIRECLSGKQLDKVYRHEKYKTKLCTKFLSGFCSYSSFCQFAHGPEELRIKRTN